MVSETSEIVLQTALTFERAGFKLSAALKSSDYSMALVGPSGSGKSTFLRLLAGLEKPSGNSSIVVRNRVWQDSQKKIFLPPWQRSVGYVAQESLLFPTMNVFQNLKFSQGSTEEVEAMAEQLSLSTLLKRRPTSLSGGEKQRVALGRALLARPQLLLLDEPLSALDRENRMQIVNILKKICRNLKLPFLLVSHDDIDLSNLATQVWYCDNGVIRPQ